MHPLGRRPGYFQSVGCFKITIGPGSTENQSTDVCHNNLHRRCYKEPEASKQKRMAGHIMARRAKQSGVIKSIVTNEVPTFVTWYAVRIHDFPGSLGRSVDRSFLVH